MSADYTELDLAVKQSVREKLNLFGTQQDIVTLVIMYAQKNTPFYAKSKTIAAQLGKKEKTIKNALTQLYKNKDLLSFRIYRRRFLSISPNCKLFEQYNIQDKYNHRCVSRAHALQIVDKYIYKKRAVNKSVNKNQKSGTLENDYSYKYNINNIITGGRDQSLSNSYLQTGAKMKKWNPNIAKLVNHVANRRKLTLSELQNEQVVYHVQRGLAKDGQFKNEYQLVNQALSLIKNETWQNPYGFVSKVSKQELNSEKLHIERWEKQKKQEISRYKRQSDGGKGLTLLAELQNCAEITQYVEQKEQGVYKYTGIDYEYNANREDDSYSEKEKELGESEYDSEISYQDLASEQSYCKPPESIEQRIIINTPFVENNCKSFADLMRMTRELVQ